MATLLDITFEGSTAGATITTGNSGFTQFVDPGWTFVSSPVLATGGGTRAARSAGTSTQSSAATAPFATSSIVYSRFYIYTVTRPTANRGLVQLLATDGTTVRAELQMTSTGAVRMRNSAFTLLATSGADSLPLNDWARVEWRFDLTNLRQQLRIYNGANLHTDTTTYDSGALTIPNSGTVAQIYLGSIENTGNMTTVWDNIKIDNTTWVGSAVTAAPTPVANAGADQTVDPHTATTFTLDGSASTGSITSSLWEDITDTPTTVAGSGLTRTVTIPKNTEQSTRTYRLTTTNASGSTTDTVTVTINRWRFWYFNGTALVARKRNTVTTLFAP